MPTVEIPGDARICGEKSLANGDARFDALKSAPVRLKNVYPSERLATRDSQMGNRY